MNLPRIAAPLAAIGLGLTVLMAQNPASGQTLPTTITVDENGNGSFLNALGSGTLAETLANDPAAGGLQGVLTYTLPFAGLPGDVVLLDGNGDPGDVLRFNGDGTFLFYSDSPPLDSIADTPSPPQFLPNTFRTDEVGPEDQNGAFYTPTANQPGYDPLRQPTYHFISDNAPAVPEAGVLGLLGLGMLPLALLVRRRRLGA